MSILLAIVSGLLFICLILATAMHPLAPRLSHSELRRRAKRSGADGDELEMRRFEAQPTLVTLLRTIRAVLLVFLVCALIGAFGWGLGILFAVLGAVFYPVIARIKTVNRWAVALYAKVELTLLRLSEKYARIMLAVREPSTVLQTQPRRIFSREDLAELIQNSKEVINSEERALLSSAFAFFGKTVADVMTPRTVINFIKNSEFIGPLVLDELHALGHSRLPVIDEDLDHVVGVLHIRDLLSLDVRKSMTAEKLMEKKVYYIHENDTLEHALAAFLKTRHHLFIVINENRETVGLVTLEDTIEALIGRTIVDEDDIHADLRAVAAQEGKSNNAAPGYVDL